MVVLVHDVADDVAPARSDGPVARKTQTDLHDEEHEQEAPAK